MPRIGKHLQQGKLTCSESQDRSILGVLLKVMIPVLAAKSCKYLVTSYSLRTIVCRLHVPNETNLPRSCPPHPYSNPFSGVFPRLVEVEFFS